MLPITIVLIILSCYELDKFFEKVFLFAQNEIKKVDYLADYNFGVEIYDFYHNKTNNYPSKEIFNKKYPKVKQQVYSFPFQFVKFGLCNETYEIKYDFNKTENMFDVSRRNLNGEALLIKRHVVINDSVERYVQKIFEFINNTLNNNTATCGYDK